MTPHNTSRFPHAVIRTLVAWVLADRDAESAVRYVRVMNTRHAYSGLCSTNRTITIRIGGPEHFPQAVKYPGLKRAPEYTFADPIEALVGVIAHEAEHARQFVKVERWKRHKRAVSTPVTSDAPFLPLLGARPKLSEIEAEHAAHATLLRFREAREGLGLEAIAERVAEKHTALVAQRERTAARRAEKVKLAAAPETKRAKLLAAIKSWTTKAKRAETALKKYRRRLARIDKLIAAGGAS